MLETQEKSATILMIITEMGEMNSDKSKLDGDERIKLAWLLIHVKRSAVTDISLVLIHQFEMMATQMMEMDVVQFVK